MVITTSPLSSSSSSSTRRGPLGRSYVAVPRPPVFVQTTRLEKIADRSRQRLGWTQSHRPSRQQNSGPSGFPAAPRLETDALADEYRQHSAAKPAYRPPRPPTPGPSGASAQPCANCGRRGHAARDGCCPARDQACTACFKVGHFAVACRSSAPASGRQDRRQRQRSQHRRRHDTRSVGTDLSDDVDSIIIASDYDHEDLSAISFNSVDWYWAPPEVDSDVTSAEPALFSAASATQSSSMPASLTLTSEQPSASGKVTVGIRPWVAPVAATAGHASAAATAYCRPKDTSSATSVASTSSAASSVPSVALATPDVFSATPELSSKPSAVVPVIPAVPQATFTTLSAASTVTSGPPAPTFSAVPVTRISTAPATITSAGQVSIASIAPATSISAGSESAAAAGRPAAAEIAYFRPWEASPPTPAVPSAPPDVSSMTSEALSSTSAASSETAAMFRVISAAPPATFTSVSAVARSSTSGRPASTTSGTSASSTSAEPAATSAAKPATFTSISAVAPTPATFTSAVTSVFSAPSLATSDLFVLPVTAVTASKEFYGHRAPAAGGLPLCPRALPPVSDVEALLLVPSSADSRQPSRSFQTAPYSPTLSRQFVDASELLRRTSNEDAIWRCFRTFFPGGGGDVMTDFRSRPAVRADQRSSGRPPPLEGATARSCSSCVVKQLQPAAVADRVG